MTTISRGDFSQLRADHESQHAILENSTVHLKAFRDRIACLGNTLLLTGAVKNGQGVDKNARQSMKLLKNLEKRFSQEVIPAWGKAQNAVSIERDFLSNPSSMHRPGTALAHSKAVEFAVRQMETVQNDFKNSFLKACHHLFNTLDQDKIQEVAEMFEALNLLEETVCGISEYEMQNCRVQLMLKGYEDDMEDRAANAQFPEVKAAATAAAEQFRGLRSTVLMQKETFLASEVQGRSVSKLFESAIQRFTATTQKLASGDTSYAQVMVQLAQKHSASGQIMSAMSDLADIYGVMREVLSNSTDRLAMLEDAAQHRQADLAFSALESGKDLATATQGIRKNTPAQASGNTPGKLQNRSPGNADSTKNRGPKDCQSTPVGGGSSVSRPAPDPAQAFAQASRELAVNLYKACDWLKEDLRDLAQSQSDETQALAEGLETHLQLIESKIETQEATVQSDKGLEGFKKAILSDLEGVEKSIQAHESLQKRQPPPVTSNTPSGTDAQGRVPAKPKRIVQADTAPKIAQESVQADPVASKPRPERFTSSPQKNTIRQKVPSQSTAPAESRLPAGPKAAAEPKASVAQMKADSPTIAKAPPPAMKQTPSIESTDAIAPSTPDAILYQQLTGLVDHLNFTHQQYAQAVQQTQGLRQHLLVAGFPDHPAWTALYHAEQILGLAGVELIQQPHLLYIRPYMAVELPVTEMIRSIQADWGHPHFNHLNVQGYCQASQQWLNVINVRLGAITAIAWDAYSALNEASDQSRH